VENTQRIEEDSMAPRNNDGRDELNLAEFPICALAHRLRPEQKTLRFEDRLFDRQRGEMITRQLTITGSDAYGLPTALDDEVLLGLIQLTRLRDFTDRKVPFSRHQLLRLLGWRNDSKSYARLEASLNRWTGVTLYYRNAWWNLARKCWVDEKFHILDNVWVCHRDSPLPDTGLATGGSPVSAFVWNEVLFRSFQAGNLKSLDFDFYRDLRSAVAKRLYRFLDKRFYQRGRWEFDLKEFAWEHAGLARGYDAGNLKRKLRAGIAELEQKGYLKPLPETARFRKLCSGQWRVAFERATEKQVGTSAVGPGEVLVAALVERGVAPSTARRLVEDFTAEQIEAKLQAFDWLQAQTDPRVSRNPPGFLIAAIRDDYSPPRDFVHQKEQKERERANARRKRRAEERKRRQDFLREASERERQTAIGEFWKSLSEEERLQAETEALEQASPHECSMIAQAGSLGATAKKVVLDAYALKQLQLSV